MGSVGLVGGDGPGVASPAAADDRGRDRERNAAVAGGGGGAGEAALLGDIELPPVSALT